MTDAKPDPNSPAPLDALQAILDAIPNSIFLIDRQAEVHLVNSCAQGQRHLLDEYTYRQRMGNVLGCINALSCSDGCGGSRNCTDCPIRKAVTDAFDGHNVFRRKAVFQLLADGDYQPVHMWLTAATLSYGGSDFIALILEDIAELVQTSGLMQVCTSCGKVGDEADGNESLEAYVQGRYDADFKHGVCKDCGTD